MFEQNYSKAKKYPPIFILLLCSVSLLAQEWLTTIDDIYSFSSARTADLNQDGIQDIVIGAGLEGVESEKGILAINGADGSTLWTAFARDQIFGSALFLDINNDGIEEVFIGGRAGEFRALNGSNGAVIWEFYDQADSVPPAEADIYQFYSPQWIPDQDGDNLPDLLSANGGDPTALLPDSPRPAGKLMVMSSATGELLASAEVPDEQETYMSPLVVDFFQDGTLEVLFGTGGETQVGSLWRVDLDDLLNNDISNAIALITSPVKGMIAPPSLADLNDDQVVDIVMNTYDGRIIAIDGVNNEKIWQYDIVMGETNASPAIGHFNDDHVPDVFCNFGVGLAPTFTNFVQVMLDGATGEVLWEENLGIAQFASPLSVDMDDDGVDEVIFSINNLNMEATPPYFTHEILQIDFNDDEVTTLSGPTGGANVNSTPWIGNLDNDGTLDIIYTYNADSSMIVTESGLNVKKQNLSINDAIFVAWGAYLGNTYDGQFENIKNPCADTNYDVSIEITPSSNCVATLMANSSGCQGNCEYEWSNNTNSQSANIEGTGRHTVKVTHVDGCTQVAKLDIDALFYTTETSPVTCNEQGYFRIDYGGGIPPYTTSFNGTSSGGATNATVYAVNNLSAGSYTFGLTDAMGCSLMVPITIESTNTLSIDSLNSTPVTSNPANGSASVVVNGGTFPYTYSWEENSDWTGNMITNVEAGEYTVTITDAEGCSITATIIVESLVGMEDLNNSNIHIYPNPSMGFFNIETSLIQLLGANIRMYDSKARLIWNGQLNETTLPIDITHLPPGVYWLVFQENSVHKLVKF